MMFNTGSGLDMVGTIAQRWETQLLHAKSPAIELIKLVVDRDGPETSSTPDSLLVGFGWIWLVTSSTPFR